MDAVKACFLRRVWPVWAMLALVLVFEVWPGLDLWVSARFYQPGVGFPLDHNALVQASYWLFARLHFLLLPLLLWLWLASWFWRRRAERGVRRHLLFLLLVLVLGPGLLVNEVVKRESGRARPITVEQFGGAARFTPPFLFTDQCRSNCSFVSGHAALGFYFLALAWVFRDRRWLWFGLALGALVGAGRIVQGAHFLSDVVFSLAFVYLSAMVVGRVVYGRWWALPCASDGRV